jgi:hypothetical protein
MTSSFLKQSGAIAEDRKGSICCPFIFSSAKSETCCRKKNVAIVNGKCLTGALAEGI